MQMTVYPIENHPCDSRVVLKGENEPCQTLNARMGTGGGNVPLILMEISNESDRLPKPEAD